MPTPDAREFDSPHAMSADLPSQHPAAGVRPPHPDASHQHETADVCSLVVVIAVALALLLLVVAQRSPEPARAASDSQVSDGPVLVIPPVRQADPTLPD
ncbi:MAG: hypothetical protein AAF328_01915 [Planctomycetota bacterium]